MAELVKNTEPRIRSLDIRRVGALARRLEYKAKMNLFFGIGSGASAAEAVNEFVKHDAVAGAVLGFVAIAGAGIAVIDTWSEGFFTGGDTPSLHNYEDCSLTDYEAALIAVIHEDSADLQD